MNLQENIQRIKEIMGLLTESDPKVGTGKKPEGSGRRLYTDENPSDTVSVKFRTKEDIINTLNKESFKSKPHKRQSQIINLIHQRVRAAYQNAKDPETKQRLKRGLDYIEGKKEQSKQKTIRLQKEGEIETNEYARTLKNARKQGVGLRFPKSAIKSNPQRFRHYTRQNTNELKNKGEQNEFELTEKCWSGYTQKGMKTMFGKRYPNCVKKTKK